jgi:hypothetical protein
MPTQDIELVARLRRAGAIVAGKTNVPEMGAGANSRNDVWGATGNPFNPNLNAGGSSGIGRGTGLRHAAGVHWLGYRRFPAHSSRQMRRGGVPPLAGHCSQRAQAAGLDAALGRRSHGAHGGRCLPAAGGQRGRACR